MFVNGPVNVIRLEGQIENVKKVLHVFMDIPSPSIEYQTECPEIEAIDIAKYIKDEIDTVPNKTSYDIFIDTNPKMDINLRYTGTYYDQLDKLFFWKYGKNADVRYHYFDVINRENINDILVRQPDFIKILDDVFGKVKKTYDSIFDSKNMNKDTNKIWNKYNNSNIKKVMIEQLEKYKKMFDDVFMLFDKIRGEYDEKILFGMPDKLKYLRFGIVDIGDINEVELQSKMRMDTWYLWGLYSDIIRYVNTIYFLRRFLDKSYIKNGIMYGHVKMCANSINILTTEFGFRVTHAAKIYENKINTSTILSTMNNFISDYTSMLQCSNLIDFPRHFY